MLNLIIRTLQNTPHTGYKSSTMGKGTVCVCVYDTLATGFSDLFPLLSKIKKKLYTDEAQYLYVFVTKPQVASCFPVCHWIYTLKESSLSLEVPQRAQLTTATAKIFIDETAWCLPHLMSKTCDLLNSKRHHFHTLPYRPTPARFLFFLGEK